MMIFPVFAIQRGDFQFRISFICTLISSLLFLIAFVSPYWLESWHSTHSRFKNLGLWEFCVNGYSHPKDHAHIEHYGCKMLFSQTFWWVRGWLIPVWFVFVIIFNIISLALLAIATVSQITIFYILLKRPEPNYNIQLVSAACLIFATFFNIIAAITFSVGRNDWEWMERPDYNFLSWSYGLFCGSIFFSFIGALAAFAWGVQLRRNQLIAKPPIPMGTSAGY